MLKSSKQSLKNAEPEQYQLVIVRCNKTARTADVFVEFRRNSLGIARSKLPGTEGDGRELLVRDEDSEEPAGGLVFAADVCVCV